MVQSIRQKTHNCERLWIRTPIPTGETIFQAPLIWIKAWNKTLWKTLTWHCCICCNPANGRVDFEEWLAYKIQLHGTEWIVSLSPDWHQSPSIIIVLKYGRISKEERINLEIISKIFDRLWCNSCVIVATHYEWELNSEGVLDEDIEKREIEKWIGNDK